MTKKFKIAGLGEVLWDVHGEEKTFGGAPANFACHCHTLGAQAFVISCIGNDDLGNKGKAFLDNHGVNISGLAVSDEFKTGIVLVTLDDKGKPEYDIKEGVAWDNIPFTAKMAEIAPKLDAVCFGSLVQRNPISRETVEKFLDATKPDCLRIFDINLRQHYYSDEIIKSSLKHANILKLNDEELPLLANLLDISGSMKEQLKAIAEKCELKLAILTVGPEGAWMVRGNEIEFAQCYDLGPIASTVGAGDSFTATAVMGYLKKNSLSAINKHANLVASYVCTQVGAVPPLPDKFQDPEEADRGNYPIFVPQ